jgi:hypothetical protein
VYRGLNGFRTGWIQPTQWFIQQQPLGFQGQATVESSGECNSLQLPTTHCVPGVGDSEVKLDVI